MDTRGAIPSDECQVAIFDMDNLDAIGNEPWVTTECVIINGSSKRHATINLDLFPNMTNLVFEGCNLKKLSIKSSNNRMLYAIDAIKTENIQWMRLDYANLNGLDISITNFIPNGISRALNLRRLSIRSSNFIGAIPSVLSHMNHLRELHLNGMNLREIPHQIYVLSRLGRLDLSDNKIDSIPYNILDMHSLKGLNLSKNDFDEFPINALLIQAIERINLCDNESVEANLILLNVPSNVEIVTSSSYLLRKRDCSNDIYLGQTKFGKLKQIEWDDVRKDKSFNKACKPDTYSMQYNDCSGKFVLGDSVMVGKKIIPYEEIKSIHTSMDISKLYGRYWPNLTSITVEFSPNIVDINLDLFPAVDFLCVTGSVLKGLKITSSKSEPFLALGIYEVDNASTFELSPAIISELHFRMLDDTIPEFVIKSTNLTHLSIIGVEETISSPDLSNLTKLRTLSLSSIGLTEIPSYVSAMPRLLNLWLGCNKIRNIPKDIELSSTLKSISLGFNALDLFPAHLLKMPALKSLRLCGNQDMQTEIELHDIPFKYHIDTNYSNVTADYTDYGTTISNLKMPKELQHLARSQPNNEYEPVLRISWDEFIQKE